MFTSVMAAGSKALGGARFSLTTILPGTVLVALVLATWRAGAYGDGQITVSAIIPRPDELTAGGSVVLIFGVFLAGVLIQPFQVALVQYLEGYWGGFVGASLGVLAIERHRRRFRRAVVRGLAELDQPPTTDLADAVVQARDRARLTRMHDRAEATERQYPEPDRIMATMLGNVLRRTEDGPGLRYGLDAMTAYPRLYPSISKPLLDALGRQLDLITLSGTLCVTFALAAAATAPAAFRHPAAVAIPVAAALLSLLAYRGALRAATAHARYFATVFDLHRFDMMRALHHELPRTPADELTFNGALTRFLQDVGPARGLLAASRYAHPEPVPTTAAVTTPPPEEPVTPSTGQASSGPSSSPPSP